MYGMPVTTAGASTRWCATCRSTTSRARRMNATLKELEEERAGVASLLG
jgi:hypothetical protein